MTAARWAAALDEFAVCLAEQERLLAERRPELIESYAPPAGLGPLPAELGGRARALVERSDALAAQVAQAMDATRRHLVLARRLTSDTSALPSYVDQLA